jgi:hypothetical protein
MKLNYSDMATKELRAKVLADPTDQDAFYAYIDRRHQEVKNPIEIELNDPDWEAKTQAIMQKFNHHAPVDLNH